jgi:succinoglycan biosynthesis protein ExoA
MGKREDSEAKQTPPIVSIVVPCRNEAAQIEACVRSILAQQVDLAKVELIVADGMSNDGTREILDRFAAQDPRLRIVDNPRQIVSSGLNAAIREAHGQIIIRFDAHTEYAPDYVQQCLEVLQETGADNVGGPWVARGKGYSGLAIAAAFQSSFAFGGARGHDPEYEGELDSVYLGCWRRELFQRIGYFDEELVRNQDDEFNLRLVRSGGRVWQSPRIRSWYQPRSSLKDLLNQYLQYGYWKVRVIQKHRLPASIRHIVPAGFLATLILLMLAAPFGAIPAYGLALLVGTYALCITIASVITAARTRFSLLPILPLVFACYHLSYGAGFLKGIWDFNIRKRASPFAEKLTRPMSPPASRSRPGRKPLE